MKVIIDTNAWIYAMLHKVRILEELKGFEVYVLEGTINELRQIAGTRKKEGVAAKLALRLIEKEGVRVVPHRGRVDEKLLELARQGYAVLTHDEELRKRIKAEGGKLACIRQGSYVEFF